MTASTAFAVWGGNGGHGPLNIADVWIFFADWPMVLLHGIDFYVSSEEAFIVNAVGWTLIGLVIGVLLRRKPN